MNNVLDLSIILLVWRDRVLLRACLESIAAARGDLSLEIVVIENGITLQKDEYATENPVALQVIHNTTNCGIAPARNQGLRVARGRYFLLLDVDTRVTPDALTNLVRFMDSHPDVGLAGARLQDARGNLQFTCRKLPTVWGKLLRRIPMRWAQDALADEMLTSYDHRTPREVDYVIGACQIIRREAYIQVGVLDEGFFYGPEDVDYCIRMWRHGWHVMYVPQ
ncbi:MAG TPA: glycosyltransferase family 2 protein, partial [Anaerolineae bacterium]|nr:glycosyltransferase family 2 protein [Anaerolineae bacterium]